MAKKRNIKWLNVRIILNGKEIKDIHSLCYSGIPETELSIEKLQELLNQAENVEDYEKCITIKKLINEKLEKKN